MKERKTILLIDNSVAVTGAFKCALTEAGLLKEHFEFIFIVPSNSTVQGKIKENGFRYYTLPMLEISKSPKNLLLYFPTLLQNAWLLLTIIQKEKVHVVQMNDFYNLLGVAVKILGYKGRLITYVRFLPQAVPSPLRTLWTGFAQRYADAVVAVSDAVLNQLPSHPKNRRIYDAIVLDEKWPSITNIENGSVHFLYLGNYIRGKGQDHAIRAFREVVSQLPGVHLTFVGGDMGLQKNKDFKKELEGFAAEQQLTDAITFKIFTDDIEKEIKDADIVLNFSEAESFSMTCAEASFYGIPVIATRCGGPEEILMHQKTGLLVENKNIREMTAAMLQLAGSKEKRIQMGKEARLYIRSKFNSDKYVQQFANMLNKFD